MAGFEDATTFHGGFCITYQTNPLIVRARCNVPLQLKSERVKILKRRKDENER
jgi:hypothetical protein